MAKRGSFVIWQLLLFVGVVFICTKSYGQAKIQPANADHGKIVLGVASFYSKSLQGSETSTGETLDQDKMTGASNFFKLNAWVRVTNLSNNKSIVVRINDRMHQRMADRGRVIDVTRGGAIQLGYLYRGLTRVKLEEVPPNTKE
ncbi:septal ring lytic transglycosylase RlpA family protein [Rhizosphaericola mali]|uniref:septal ring lytic transglycosylase RlpA family protein n=1 Tax=Rhizosphaericola mali TaxID=2545455 RepID=UPI00177DD0B4|nr:septal ring lytic transglycosylase RlpA family protein [Rhizosphaericola mali]